MVVAAVEQVLMVVTWELGDTPVGGGGMVEGWMTWSSGGPGTGREGGEKGKEGQEEEEEEKEEEKVVGEEEAG